MNRPRAEKHEVRLAGRDGVLVVDPSDRLVNQVFSQMIALFNGLSWFDGRGVEVKLWVVLAGFATKKAVEMLEAQPNGPLIKRSRCVTNPIRRVMPLAKQRRVVAVVLEYLWGSRSSNLGSYCHIRETLSTSP